MVRQLLGLKMGLVTNVRRLIPFSSNRWFMKFLYGVIGSLSIFLMSWESGDRFVDRIRARFHGKEDKFDFIIVGGGSAGAVVANRLAENPAWKVLLLEAGGDPSPFHSIPGFALYLNNFKSTDWQHWSVPQKQAGGFQPNRQFLLSQGRSLGGTSNINHLIHSRGNPQDFNNWANITGDNSWCYEKVLPYFVKSEDFSGEWSNSSVHGTGGPVRVEVPNYHPLASNYIDAGAELGYSKADLNGYYTEGFDNIYYNTKRGQRHSMFRSYIRPARRRRNLSVYKFSLVTKILVNANNLAHGVEYERHGRTRQAFASREVILSAGALQTPKILMLSGIGPADHLKDLGIPVKADLPVGNNLQDHIVAIVGPFNIDEPQSLLFDRDVSPKALLRYLTKGQGVMTSALTQANSIVASAWSKARASTPWPDLQTLFLPVGTHQSFAKDVSHAFGFLENKVQEFHGPSVGRDGIITMVSLGRPLSKGTVRLTSSNPKDDLVIDPKYFEHPDDLPRLVEGMKLNVRLLEETQSFKRLGAKLPENPVPGCKDFAIRSDAYWECSAKNYAFSLNHYSGTTPMGKPTDINTVVDSKLRVKGVENLRVIDASVMPEIPVSNTQASVIMIAERGSDLIKQAWLGSDTSYGAPGKQVGSESIPGLQAPSPLPEGDNQLETSSDSSSSSSTSEVPEVPPEVSGLDQDVGFRTGLPKSKSRGNSQKARNNSISNETMSEASPLFKDVESIINQLTDIQDFDGDADGMDNSELSDLMDIDQDLDYPSPGELLRQSIQRLNLNLTAPVPFNENNTSTNYTSSKNITETTTESSITPTTLLPPLTTTPEAVVATPSPSSTTTQNIQNIEFTTELPESETQAPTDDPLMQNEIDSAMSFDPEKSSTMNETEKDVLIGDRSLFPTKEAPASTSDNSGESVFSAPPAALVRSDGVSQQSQNSPDNSFFQGNFFQAPRNAPFEFFPAQLVSSQSYFQSFLPELMHLPPQTGLEVSSLLGSPNVPTSNVIPGSSGTSSDQFEASPVPPVVESGDSDNSTQTTFEAPSSQSDDLLSPAGETAPLNVPSTDFFQVPEGGDQTQALFLNLPESNTGFSGQDSSPQAPVVPQEVDSQLPPDQEANSELVPSSQGELNVQPETPPGLETAQEFTNQFDPKTNLELQINPRTAAFRGNQESVQLQNSPQAFQLQNSHESFQSQPAPQQNFQLQSPPETNFQLGQTFNPLFQSRANLPPFSMLSSQFPPPNPFLSAPSNAAPLEFNAPQDTVENNMYVIQGHSSHLRFG